jgi:hypothetical protein
MALLILAGVALLPLWRPASTNGVPAATLSDAPQYLGAYLRTLTPGSGNPNVWAPQQWGSWIEFIAPNWKVAVDSRIELFPPDTWADNTLVAQVDGSWREIVDRYAVEVIVIDAHDLALSTKLEGQPGWQLVYADDEAAIWRRESP